MAKRTRPSKKDRRERSRQAAAASLLKEGVKLLPRPHDPEVVEKLRAFRFTWPDAAMPLTANIPTGWQRQDHDMSVEELASRFPIELVSLPVGERSRMEALGSVTFDGEVGGQRKRIIFVFGLYPFDSFGDQWGCEAEVVDLAS